MTIEVDRDALYFPVHPEDRANHLTIRNTSDFARCFKVRITAPLVVCVKPSSGWVGPGCEKKLYVLPNSSGEKMVRLQVQWLSMTEEETKQIEGCHDHEEEVDLVKTLYPLRKKSEIGSRIIPIHFMMTPPHDAALSYDCDLDNVKRNLVGGGSPVAAVGGEVMSEVSPLAVSAESVVKPTPSPQQIQYSPSLTPGSAREEVAAQAPQSAAALGPVVDQESPVETLVVTPVVSNHNSVTTPTYTSEASAVPMARTGANGEPLEPWWMLRHRGSFNDKMGRVEMLLSEVTSDMHCVNDDIAHNQHTIEAVAEACKVLRAGQQEMYLLLQKCEEREESTAVVLTDMASSIGKASGGSPVAVAGGIGGTALGDQGALMEALEVIETALSHHTKVLDQVRVSQTHISAFVVPAAVVIAVLQLAICILLMIA